MYYQGKTVYTDGRKKYFVRAGLSDEPAHNYKVFYCDADRTDGQGQHGYTGRGNPWTGKEAAEII